VENVGARPHAKETRTLEGTVFAPAGDAFLAKQFSTIVTLHGVLKQFYSLLKD
jgi:hypothetical protein